MFLTAITKKVSGCIIPDKFTVFQNAEFYLTATNLLTFKNYLGDPEAAKKEGIASILSVPIVIGGNAIGAMRVYTAEPWECTLEDVNFVLALAQMSGMLIEMCRLYQGQKEYIDVLTTMKDARDM